MLPRKRLSNAEPRSIFQMDSKGSTPPLYAMLKQPKQKITEKDAFLFTFDPSDGRHPSSTQAVSSQNSKMAGQGSPASQHESIRSKTPCERLSRGYPMTAEDVRYIEKATKIYQKPTIAKDLFTMKAKSYHHNMECKSRKKQPVCTSSAASNQKSPNVEEPDPRDSEIRDYLCKHPDYVLEQLRRTLQPGTLTEVIDDIVNYPSARHSRAIFSQAMQKAIPIDGPTTEDEKM